MAQQATKQRNMPLHTNNSELSWCQLCRQWRYYGIVAGSWSNCQQETVGKKTPLAKRDECFGRERWISISEFRFGRVTQKERAKCTRIFSLCGDVLDNINHFLLNECSKINEDHKFRKIRDMLDSCIREWKDKAYFLGYYWVDFFSR